MKKILLPTLFFTVFSFSNEKSQIHSIFDSLDLTNIFLILLAIVGIIQIIRNTFLFLLWIFSITGYFINRYISQETLSSFGLDTIFYDKTELSMIFIILIFILPIAAIILNLFFQSEKCKKCDSDDILEIRKYLVSQDIETSSLSRTIPEGGREYIQYQVNIYNIEKQCNSCGYRWDNKETLKKEI